MVGWPGLIAWLAGLVGCLAGLGWLSKGMVLSARREWQERREPKSERESEQEERMRKGRGELSGERFFLSLNEFRVRIPNT